MIIFCGVGVFEENLLLEILKNWDVKVIEKNKSKSEKIKQLKGNLSVKQGDATSAIIWKQIQTEDIEFVIATFRDSDLSLEVCWIVRSILKLEVPIIVLLYDEGSEDKFKDVSAIIVKPMDISINIILNKLQKNYSRAIDIGQKKGEIIELNVISKSHITDRKLKNLRPSKWHLAALYRNNELIIPTGETKIKVGDRIVVAGEPKVLENLAGIFAKGIPQFPLQFGEVLAVAMDKSHPWLLEEALNLNANVRTTGLKIFLRDTVIDEASVDKLHSDGIKYTTENKSHSKIRFIENKDNIGMHAITFNSGSILEYFKAREIFKSADKPVFISKNTFKYNKIVISLNCFDPVYPMETGMELSRLIDIPFEVIYSGLPKGMRGETEENLLEERSRLVQDFGNIFRCKIDYHILEGNPIVKTLKYVNNYQKALYVCSFKKNNPGTLLKPDVGFYTAYKSTVSSIAIPQKVENE